LNRIIDSLILDSEIVLPLTDLNLDYLNIEEICSAYITIFRYLKEFQGKGLQRFEISSGNSYKLSQIISMVEALAQKRLRIALNRKNRDLSAVSEIKYSQNYPPKWKSQSSLEQDLSGLIDNRKLMLSKGNL
jgi:UDP-glucose 4-epimerase